MSCRADFSKIVVPCCIPVRGYNLSTAYVTNQSNLARPLLLLGNLVQDLDHTAQGIAFFEAYNKGDLGSYLDGKTRSNKDFGFLILSQITKRMLAGLSWDE